MKGVHMDILLDKSGDLYVSPLGDIVPGDSVAQKIVIRLKWFEGEWRWNREEGLPYTERLFRKNPDTDLMEAAVRAKIFEVPEVTAVREVKIDVDRNTRNAVVRFVALTDSETIKGDVTLYAGIRGDG